MPFSRETFHKLLVAVEGEGRIDSDDDKQSVSWSAGDVVLIPAGVRHRLLDSQSRAMSILGLCVDPKTISANPLLGEGWRLIENQLGTLKPFKPNDLYHRTQIERRLRSMLFELVEDRPACMHALWGQCLELFAELNRAAQPSTASRRSADRDPRFAATLTWLQHHFHQPISVTELAARCGLSYRGFTHRFRATTKTAVVEFISRLRLAHACRLLRAGTAIVDAALSSGYADLSHFYRQFKRQFGCTPAQWVAKNS